MDTKMEVKYNNNGLTQPRKREKAGKKIGEKIGEKIGKKIHWEKQKNNNQKIEKIE